MDAIVQVIGDWSLAKDIKSKLTAIFFNMEKAFDLVEHQLLLTKLQRHLPQISWHASYLTDRQQRVKITNHITDWVQVNAGVIQGSVLGPVLFILFLDDLNDSLPEGIMIVKYAYDILCYIIGDYDPGLLQSIVDGVGRWCVDNKMRLNEKKFQVLIVSFKSTPHVELNEHILEQFDEYKYLGFNLTSNLNWNQQSERLRKITRGVPYLIKQLKKDLNLKPQSLLQFTLAMF